MNPKTCGLHVLKRIKPPTKSKAGKKFPWKTGYWALIALLKDKYEKYMYHCRIIY